MPNEQIAKAHIRIARSHLLWARRHLKDGFDGWIEDSTSDLTHLLDELDAYDRGEPHDWEDEIREKAAEEGGIQ